MPFLPIGDSSPRILIERPYVTWGLIGICVAVFILQSGLDEREARVMALQLGLIPKVLLSEAALDPRLALVPAWATLGTSMFLHGGIGHLAVNMLFLAIFGDNIEDALGHLRFAAFYVACGAAAGLTHALTLPGSAEPMIGASGAVSGVLGAYLVLYPWAWVTLLFGWIPLVLPAWLMLSIWIAFQVLSGIFAAGGGVAWWAHVGGFAAGIVLIRVMRRRTVGLASRGQYPKGVRFRRWR